MIFFFVCIFLVFHPVFSSNYYLMSLYLLLLGVVCKIIVDWIQTEFAIAMTTIVGTSLLTFNFNLGAIKALMLNSLNSINFIIRIVVVYYAEGYNKIEITDETSINTNLRKFFAIASFVIMVIFVFLLSVYVIYKSERDKRSFFISQQTIKHAQTDNDNLLSILVPKFV